MQQRLLYGLPDYRINKLQRIQNAAARLICQQSRFCHITPPLFDLHWLPVKFRIEFKILLFTFKALKGLAPTYIDSLISIHFTVYDLRSSNDSLLLSYPKLLSKATLRDRSFTHPSVTDPVDYFPLPSGNLVSPVPSEYSDFNQLFLCFPSDCVVRVTLHTQRIFLQTNKKIKIIKIR